MSTMGLISATHFHVHIKVKLSSFSNYNGSRTRNRICDVINECMNHHWLLHVKIITKSALLVNMCLNSGKIL